MLIKNKYRLFEMMGKINSSFLLEDVLRKQPDFLYNITNIKHADEIKKWGLYPHFGETLKKASYGDYYDFDHEDEPDEYGNYERQKPDYEGILFFSDDGPHIKYADFHMGNMNTSDMLDQAVLSIVEKNETTFHKIDDERVTDYKGNVVDYVPADREEYGGFATYELPVFIERGDWFSFEEQEPVAVLTGNELKEFMVKNNFKI